MAELNNKDVYRVIAGRLVWDHEFFTHLQKTPRAAIAQTLSMADIPYNDDMLDSLEDEYNRFIEGNKPHDLHAASLEYLGGDPSVDAV